MVAFLTGIISVYSSTSGVVLPAFLPMVPGLAEQLGGASPLAIASSMTVGGHLVDVSPLSTIGALCIAGARVEDSRNLFNKLLAWGLSMSRRRGRCSAGSCSDRGLAAGHGGGGARRFNTETRRHEDHTGKTRRRATTRRPCSVALRVVSVTSCLRVEPSYSCTLRALDLQICASNSRDPGSADTSTASTVCPRRR